jgi:NAD(P)-dependent dehydrogenase (short-subunit alcohol dehydrogenase family)
LYTALACPLTPSSGIGFAAAQNFAKSGLCVVLVDVSPQLAEAVEAVRAVPGVGQVEGFKADVSSAADVRDLRDKVFEIFGEVDFHDPY